MPELSALVKCGIQPGEWLEELEPPEFMSPNPGLELPSSFVNHRGLECADPGPFTIRDRRIVHHGGGTMV